MLCVLIVNGISVAVNVMLSLMCVMSPPPATYRHAQWCTLGVLALGVSLVSRIVMISACVS